MKLSLFSWIRQVLLGILARRPNGCHYINGPETLPPPLTKEQEAKVFENIRQGVPGSPTTCGWWCTSPRNSKAPAPAWRI